MRKGFNSLVGRRKQVTFDNYHNLSQKLSIAKIDSALGTMGRGNPLPFPLPIMPRRFLCFFSLSLPTTQTAEERGITSQSVVKIYCGPSVTKLSRDFITYTDKKIM